jgi:radical SAM superfamily enzyme YgiQ (UPF0313 family)
MGKVFRKRSVESVLAEMKELRFRYGFREFEIIDDCFNLDRERMCSILIGIRDQWVDIKLHFPNIRADLLEPQDMTLFKQAGTVSAAFAIETTSPRLQKMIHKNLNIERAVGTINASVRMGIYSMGYFMIGFPTETLAEAYDTANFADRSLLHRALFYIPVPFAGTELADMSSEFLKRKSDIINACQMHYYDHSLNMSAMSDRDLQKVFQYAYRRFYLNPKRILRLDLHHPNILSLPYYASLTLSRSFPRRYKSTECSM